MNWPMKTRHAPPVKTEFSQTTQTNQTLSARSVLHQELKKRREISEVRQQNKYLKKPMHVEQDPSCAATWSKTTIFSGQNIPVLSKIKKSVHVFININMLPFMRFLHFLSNGISGGPRSKPGWVINCSV